MTRAERRIQRELTTVRTMIGIFCKVKHGTKDGLCAECQGLWEYADLRVEHCRLKDDKPTCLRCPVHCFKPAMRERIREVMRFAGPRMPLRHPVLSVLHLIDGRRAPKT